MKRQAKKKRGHSNPVIITEQAASAAVKLKSSASIVSCRPQISYNNNYLLTGSGILLKVFSIDSGECVHSLAGHSDRIVTVFNHPANRYQAISFSRNGEIITWDYTDGVQIKMFKIRNEIAFALSAPVSEQLYIAIRNIKNPDTASLMKFHITPVEGRNIGSKLFSNVDLDPKKMSLGCHGKIIASISENKLRIFEIQSRKANTLYIKDTKKFTALTCHPSEMFIVTGDNEGEIHLWQNLWEKRTNIAKYHWHHMPVRCLAFTIDGSFLYSGGMEAVLVKWSWFEDFRNFFLPRLGAPILDISVSSDSFLTAVCLNDDSIHIINMQKEIIQVIQSKNYVCQWLWNLNYPSIPDPLEPPETFSDSGGIPKEYRPIPTGILPDPNSSCLVFNSKPGHVQWYNPELDKLVRHLDIGGQNPPPVEKDRRIVPLDVGRLEFSKDGVWMASVEYWSCPKFSSEVTLKFWYWDRGEQSYKLTTCVEYAHNEWINFLRFHTENSDSYLITGGLDNRFKIFRLQQDKKDNELLYYWVCAQILTCHDLTPIDARFSPNGRLAVAFPDEVTLWEIDSFTYVTSLAQSEAQTDIRSIHFGFGEHEQHLIVITKNSVVIWDTTIAAIKFVIPVSVTLACFCPKTGTMAAFNSNNDVYLIDPATYKPTRCERHLTAKPIISATYQKSSANSSTRLYLMDAEQRIYSLRTEDSDETEEQQVQVALTEQLTPFAALLKEQMKQNALKKIKTEHVKHDIVGKASNKVIEEMLMSTSYVLPALDRLCNNVLSAFLQSVNKEDTQLRTAEKIEKTRKKTSGAQIPVTEDITLGEQLKKAGNEDYSWLTDKIANL